MFGRPEESHAHSLHTLNMFYEYDDFMSSIRTVADLGCGTGLDLEWWATRTTRDETKTPLNIQCTGIDQLPELPIAQRYSNITYQKTDFEGTILAPKKRNFDVLWCHDSFQYATDPIGTLSRWYDIAGDNGMLAIVVNQTTNLYHKQQDFYQHSGCYYHHTLVSLIHMLALTGWDCASGFFLRKTADTWLHAVVYKSTHRPMNPKTTTWYELAEKNLLPESVAKCVQRYGYVKQQELVLPWLDKSLTWYGKQ